MAQFVAPGVYVLERDFSDYVAALIQTSIGMVGSAKRGPLNTPTLITSPEGFINTFGEPDANMYGPYAALNYLRRGNQLWYVRIAKEYDDGTATLESLGAADSQGRIYSFTVGAGHAILEGDYIKITQTGKATTVNALVTDVTGNVITINIPLLAAYDNSSVADTVVYLSAGGGAASQAEVFGYNRRNGTVSPLVKFTARYPGDFANYNTSQGIEVSIEDGGQFQNLNPATGDPIESTDGVPLQGIAPSKPSVDTKIDLLSLTSVGGTRVGETRGVNFDSAASAISAVADSSGKLSFTVGSSVGFNVGDTVVVNETGTYDGTYTVSSVPDGTTVVLTGYSGVITDGAITGYLDNSSGNHFGIVYKCATVDENGSTWTAVGVHTKRLVVKYQGRQVEVFDNLVAYDPSSPNYWDKVIGTPSNPISEYIYAEYLGEGGEQPMSTYDRLKFPNNPRLIMGIDTQVKIANLAAAASSTFSNPLGYNGSNPSSAEYIGTINTTTGEYKGLQNFRRVDSYDINMLAVPGISLAAVIQEMIDVLDTRGDCLGIVDPPFGLTPQEVTDWHNGGGEYTGLHSAFVTNKAALYYPWVRQYDPYSRRDLWLPPSTFLPGIIAYNDEVGETWFAPAGIIRGKVPNALGVEHDVTRGDVEYFYGPGSGNAINPVQKFARDGIVVYGQRTLQRHPSALDRVNVRRLLFYIEKAVATASRKLVFEQNDAVLWGQFKNLVDPFLKSLRGRRALEWYQIVCDETTNTPQRRNNNEMLAKIYLIPVKSAEKIILDFTLLASGANVDEFIALDLNGQIVNTQ